MQMGIDLDNYVSPMEDIENIINMYGLDTEIGYLKLNPTRLPVIVSEKKTYEKIDRFGEHEMQFQIGNRFTLITDDRTVVTKEGDFYLIGDTFVAKQQGEIYTGNTFREFMDWNLYMLKNPRVTNKLHSILYCGVNSFEIDLETGVWR